MLAQSLHKAAKNRVYSHIYNKSVENTILFKDEDDYSVFLGYLNDYLTAPPDPNKIKKTFSVKGRTFQGVPHQPKNYFNKIEVVSYSLAPNHFHLLVRQLAEGSIEKLIRSLCTRYAIYYNKKYTRRGSLFAGPYKSVQITDISQLLHLTRYFHRESFEASGNEKGLNLNGYSSYEEYLGIRNTAWVKPEVVLVFFDKSENAYFKGKNGYKNFVEKYELKQNEKKMLEGIIIEIEPEHPERKIVESARSKPVKKISAKPTTKSILEPVSKPVVEPVPKPRTKIPEFIATATIVFVLLFAVGLRNVTTSTDETAESINPLPSNSQVSGVSDSQVDPIPTQIQATELISPTPSPTPTTTPEVEEVQPDPPRAGGSKEPEAKIMVVIKITDGSESVNIRQEPTIYSEKTGEALDGETFEFVSIDLEWYQIKLDDKSIAFISARYAQIEEGENN